MKVLLTYFKFTGKYYSTGEYETTKEHMHQIFDEVRDMANSCTLPGLCRGSKFLAMVDVPDHPLNHPYIVMHDEVREIMKQYIETGKYA